MMWCTGELTNPLRLSDFSRNYHVFYYLLLGASEEERKEFKLLPPEEYFYLKQVESQQHLCRSSRKNTNQL